MLRRVLILPIKFYQKCISPWLPPTCRFHPTCSQYTVEAIEKHGAFKGGLLGAWRICRCNPLNPGGHDPVPPQGCWRCNPEGQRAAVQTPSNDESTAQTQAQSHVPPEVTEADAVNVGDRSRSGSGAGSDDTHESRD